MEFKLVARRCDTIRLGLRSSLNEACARWFRLRSQVRGVPVIRSLLRVAYAPYVVYMGTAFCPIWGKEVR